jgi:sulfur carrier protein
MKIIINGKMRFFDQAMSINGLIADLQLDPTQIAIEQNLAIVPCSEYDSTVLAEGDKIEIVQFIGGG